MNNVVVVSGLKRSFTQGITTIEVLRGVDLAHAAAQVETARALLDYGAKGDVEARITCAFTADMAHDLITRVAGREKSRPGRRRVHSAKCASGKAISVVPPASTHSARLSVRGMMRWK